MFKWFLSVSDVYLRVVLRRILISLSGLGCLVFLGKTSRLGVLATHGVSLPQLLMFQFELTLLKHMH